MAQMTTKAQNCGPGLPVKLRPLVQNEA